MSLLGKENSGMGSADSPVYLNDRKIQDAGQRRYSRSNVRKRSTYEYFKTGVVLDVSPGNNTCTVERTEGGMLENVPILGTYGGGALSQEASWCQNLRGATVVLTDIQGQPCVLTTMPALNTTALKSKTVSSGDEPYTESTYNRSTLDYAQDKDIPQLPGDKVISADGGAQLLLGREGLSILKASPMSQIVMSSLQDMVRVVARDFQIVTDFGELNFKGGSGGSTGLSITGGEGYDAETTADGSSSRTARLYLGEVPGDGDARMCLHVSSTDGGQNCVLKMGLDGNISASSSQDMKISVGLDQDTYISGCRTSEVGIDSYDFVAGISKRTVGGNDLKLVAQDQGCAVAGNDVKAVNKNLTETVKGNMSKLVEGDRSAEVKGESKRAIGGKDEFSIGGDAKRSVSGNKESSIEGDYDLSVTGDLNVGAASINLSAPHGGGGVPCTLRCRSLDIVRA